MNATNKRTAPKFGLRKTINGCDVEVSSDDRVAAANVAALLCAAPALLAFVERVSNTLRLDGTARNAALVMDAATLLRLARGS